MCDFRLADIFCDKMILQRDVEINIYGEAFHDIEISVELLETKVTQQVGKGKFKVILPGQPAVWCTRLKVCSEHQTEIIKSVAIGEVWLTVGQSNMAMWLKETELYLKDQQIKPSDKIRFYNVGRNILPNRSDYKEGYDWAYNKDMVWEECNENTAPVFSAIGYYFAHIIQEQLQVPIGILNCNAGGSSIFSWLPKERIIEDNHFSHVYFDYEKSVNEIDFVQSEKAYYHYLDSVKADWYKEEEKDKNGSEIPVIYYEEKGHFSFKNPSALYYSMAQKVEQYSVRGMLWYQGESEAFSYSSYLYKDAMDTLVKYYSSKSLNKGYNFCFVQIAPWNEPSMTDWQGICNAQRKFYLDNPGYPMITIGDCGGGADIHPPRKYPVAQRLAYAALAAAYNRKIEFTGPIAVACEGAKEIRIRFIHAEGMHLECEDYIEMEYPEGEIVKSKIFIEGDCVVLKEVHEKPQYLRYGWEPDYKINLYNGSKLPASVFRIKVSYEGDLMK